MSRRSAFIIKTIVVVVGFFAVQSGAAVNIIPKPYAVNETGGSFSVPDMVSIYSDGIHSDSTIPWVKKLFENAGKSGQHVGSRSGADVVIEFTEPSADFGDEGYKLTIESEVITIQAPTTTGQFYAVQTIRQLLPVEVERGAQVMPNAALSLPCVTIADKPALPRRGMMLDVARRFVPVTYLKECIDRLALFKMNIFHLHLSDDQGFRLQINPPVGCTEQQRNAINNLTAIGAKSQCGGGTYDNYFYTQDQMREVIDYATARKITIVPEFDMPGHCHAALHAFWKAGLNLGISNFGIQELYTGDAVGQSFMDVTDGISPVVEFYMNTLFQQIAEIFPGEYISIGADECHNFSDAGYIAAVRRFETAINNLGKKMMGWEEIFIKQAAVNATTIGQAWHQGNEGKNIIYTRCERFYLDHPQRVGVPSTNDWCVPGGEVTLRTTYEAYPFVSRYLGVEATMWTEWAVWESGYHDRQLYPRLVAVAENGWTWPGKFDWNDFRSRIAPFGGRFDMMGMSWFTNENQVEWERRQVYSDDINVYSNFTPQPVPVSIAARPLQSRPAPAGAVPQVYDLQGRVIRLKLNLGELRMEEIGRHLPGKGIYIVKQNGIVQKIVK